MHASVDFYKTPRGKEELRRMAINYLNWQCPETTHKDAKAALLRPSTGGDCRCPYCMLDNARTLLQAAQPNLPTISNAGLREQIERFLNETTIVP